MKANNLPFNSRPSAQVGKFQGIGLPAKQGTKPGSFSDSTNRKSKVGKLVPPLKFN